MNERKYNMGKHPIYPDEIEQFRENLQIGQQVMINTSKMDLDFHIKTIQQMCTVAEKYKWIFIARDQSGCRHAMTYVDMMTQEGDRQHGKADA